MTNNNHQSNCGTSRLGTKTKTKSTKTKTIGGRASCKWQDRRTATSPQQQVEVDNAYYKL